MMPRLNAFRIALLVTLAFLALRWARPSFMELMELKALDLQFLYRGAQRPGEELALVAIDEKSLDELGRWPWPRTRIAGLLDVLARGGVKAIGLDIVFPEPDEHSQRKLVASLKERVFQGRRDDPELLNLFSAAEQEADTDLRLAQAIERSQRVILGYFFHTSWEEVRHLKREQRERRLRQVLFSGYTLVRYATPTARRSAPLKEAYAAESNLPLFSQAATAAGYFNIFPDKEDGVVRRIPLVIRHRDRYFPPLSLQLLQKYLGGPMLSLRIADYGVEEIRLGEVRIPTDAQGRMLIHYRGGARTFPHYSFTDVLHGRIPPETFRDKMVLVGATAVGIYDLRVTPFEGTFPGLEVHANVIDNLLRRDFLARPLWASALGFFFILVWGLSLGGLLSRAKGIGGGAVALAGVLASVAASYGLFRYLRIWTDVVYPVATVATVYVGVTVFHYVTEEREKRKVRQAFQYYVAPAVVNEVLRNPEKLKLGGDRKELTVLFSDIRGFTTLSERLSPEELVGLLNEYLTAMTEVVFRHEGTLDKYMGDAIMAVFGAPLEQGDHARRACLTALGMAKELRVLQRGWEARRVPQLNIGIGVNTGPMVVGNMGSGRRFDYTVMGDSVNLGSRLEGLNKEYGTGILISEFTHEQVRDHFLCRELDSVRVKGKQLPVRIYELIGEVGEAQAPQEVVSLFHQGLEQYQARKWEEAIGFFRQALGLDSGDSPSRIYLERCARLIQEPPPADWDGVFTMRTK